MDELIEISSGDIEADTLCLPALCTYGIGVDVDEPGLLVGVLYDADATAPYVRDGLVTLPPADGLKNVEVTSSVNAPTLTAEGVLQLPLAGGKTTAGLVSGLRTSSVNAPALIDGELQLPFQNVMLGVVDQAGGTHYWESLAGAAHAVPVASFAAGDAGDVTSPQITLYAHQVNGFMCFSFA